MSGNKMKFDPSWELLGSFYSFARCVWNVWCTWA